MNVSILVLHYRNISAALYTLTATIRSHGAALMLFVRLAAIPLTADCVRTI